MATDEMLCAQLMKAAKTGNVKEVKKLLHKGALFTKDEYGNNALHEAAWNGHADVTKLLFKSSCFVDSINKNGCTPLHLATQNGQGKVVQVLLKCKADASILNQQGEAAVHLAVKYNHLELLTLFATAKANLNIESKDGFTPLHIAAKHGSMGVLRTLLLLGADPHKQNKKGVSAISIAEEYGQRDAAKLLKNSEDLTSNSVLELSNGVQLFLNTTDECHIIPLKTQTSRAKRSLRFSRSVLKPAKDMWHQVRRKSRSGSRDSLNEDKVLLKERKRLDLSAVSTTALAGSQLGSPDHSSLRISPIQNISGLSSSNEECSSHLPSNRHATSDGIVETRRCSSLEGMLNKDDTPALPNQNTTSDPKHTSTPIPSPNNNESPGYITMVPVKFDSPSDKRTRLSSEIEKKHKKAIINSVPVEVNRLHEPNVKLAPKKSILSQPPQSKKRADIQEELDTMKTAFEIRLSQIEKRYQRQLWLATEQANMERYNRRPSPLPTPWSQYYHQPQRMYPSHHQSKRLCSLPSRQTADTWQGNCRRRLFSDEGAGYCSDDETLRHFNYGYADQHYYYDSDDSLSEQLSPEYPEELVFPEDDLELLNKRPWFEDNDSPNGSIRSGKGNNRESKKISPHEHSETKKAIREKLAYYHEKIRQHYQDKSEARIAQRHKQYYSDVDKNDSEVTTTRLQQLEQRIQELECSLQNQTLV